MLSFTTAHVAVVALRVKDPDRPRPYRAPWNVRFRGRPVPLSACLGGDRDVRRLDLRRSSLHDEARTVGHGRGWSVGLAGYVVYRRHAGPRPDVAGEDRPRRRGRPTSCALDYRSALVPIFGADVSARTLRAAAKLVGEHATVDALYVMEVPRQLPLDGPLEAEEDLGPRPCSRPRASSAGGEGLRVRTELLRTRNPGRTIVDEARRLGSEVIYLGPTARAPVRADRSGPRRGTCSPSAPAG